MDGRTATINAANAMKSEDPMRFVVLAAGRTGSNMLCNLLHSHPEILCHHELFNVDAIYYALDYRDGSLNLGTFEERNRRPLEFLARVWQTTLGFPCIGFKYGLGHDPVVLQALLEDRGVRKIVLRRRNRIKTFVSELIAFKTGQWEVYRQGELIRDRPKVHVDLAELRQHIARNEEYFQGIDQFLQSSGQPCLRVWYEDLFADAVRLDLLRFLGVTPSLGNLSITSVKQNPKDLRELIANIAEVQSALAGSDLAGELVDVGN
jgi:LPS sulfotransferase NodH